MTALGAKLILVNAASAALVTAWNDYLDGLAAGAVVKIVPMPSGWNGKDIGSSTFPACFDGSADATYMEKVYYVIKKLNSNDNQVYEIAGSNLGRWPLFWKVTDGTELLSEA